MLNECPLIHVHLELGRIQSNSTGMLTVQGLVQDQDRHELCMIRCVRTFPSYSAHIENMGLRDQDEDDE